MKNEFERVDALPVGTMLHGYVVVSTIGAGAFGITYLVEHVERGGQYVIKEYMPDNSARLSDACSVSPKSQSDEGLFEWGLNAFIDEADLLYHLSHHNVVRVLESFEKFGTAYFVMPYIEGVTLDVWMKDHSAPKQSALENIFVPLLEGLKYIHNENILHRDIKPENILIGLDGNPILIDFGAARVAVGEKSKALSQVLTPHYASIEQYASKGDFTPALDFYGLAACMYHAICGRVPDEAPDRVSQDNYHSLVTMSFKVLYEESFLSTIDKCLNLFAKDRCQTAMEFQLGLMHKEDAKVSDEIIELENDVITEEVNGDDGKLNFQKDIEPIREVFRIKGFRRFLFHLMALVGFCVVTVTSIILIMRVSGTASSQSPEALYLSYLMAYPDSSLAALLGKYARVVAFYQIAGICFFYLYLYIKIIGLGGRQAKRYWQSLVELTDNLLPKFFVSLGLVNVAMIDGDDLFVTISLAIVEIVIYYNIFANFLDDDSNKRILSNEGEDEK